MKIKLTWNYDDYNDIRWLWDGGWGRGYVLIYILASSTRNERPHKSTFVMKVFPISLLPNKTYYFTATIKITVKEDFSFPYQFLMIFRLFSPLYFISFFFFLFFWLVGGCYYTHANHIRTFVHHAPPPPSLPSYATFKGRITHCCQ